MCRFNIQVLYAIFLVFVFTTQLVVGSTDKTSLKNIKSVDTLIFVKQNKIYADYIPVTTYGVTGLIPDVLDSKKNVKRMKEIEGYFSPIRNTLRNYSFDENFSRELGKELEKLKWFKSSQTKILKLVDERRNSYSVLNINTENHDEIEGKYLSNFNSEAILVVDPKYKIDSFFSEYVLDVAMYLYLAVEPGESKETTYDEEEEDSGSNALYKNRIRYSYRLQGLSTKSQAGAVWSNRNGPHYIENILQNSIRSVTRLIAYDLSLLASGRKEKVKKNTWSGNSLVFGDISGGIIGESATQKIFRSKGGEIYSVVLTKNLKTAKSKSRTKVSNAKPVLYIYRSEEIGSLFKTDLSIDGKPIGSTGAKTYIRTEVEPGEHTITVDAENTHEIKITLQPGMTYYIAQDMRIGFFGFKAELVPVDEIIAKPAIAESKQVR